MQLKYTPNFPRELTDSAEPCWGVWKLVHTPGEVPPVQKQLVSLTGRRPNVNLGETWVTYEVACSVRDKLLGQILDPNVTVYLNQTPAATPCGLVWLIQPGYIVLDYDVMSENPQWSALLDENSTWTERSSRGDGVHQVFSHPAKPAGVIKHVLDTIDARAAGSMLFMTGRANPAWPDIQPLTPFFEETISAKARANHEARQQVSDRSQCAGEEISDDELMARFSEDAEVLALAMNTETPLNSDVMGHFVRRLSRYTASYAQMLRVFGGFPCTVEENITLSKRRRKVTDVVTLFALHYDNMIKNGSLEPPMVKFSLSMGAETVTSIKAPELIVDNVEVLRLRPPALAKNQQVLATALNAISKVGDDVALPSVVQLATQLAGDRLRVETMYMTTENALKVSPLDDRPLVHFFTLANSGRGKSRAFRRIRTFATHMVQHHGLLMSTSPVRDMGKGVQGANKMASSLLAFNKHASEIALTDEADANFNITNDPGGAKAFLKELTENVCKPDAMTVADKTNTSKRLELHDFSVQLSFLSTIKAMKPLLHRHLGDGLIARLVMWISTEPALDPTTWNGTIEGKGPQEQIDLAFAAQLVKDCLERGPMTISYSPELLTNQPALIRRLLALSASFKGDDSGDGDDAFNRYGTYAQYLSAIYAWLEHPDLPEHSIQSLTWGIEVMEFARQGMTDLLRDIANTVDFTTIQARNAENQRIHGSRYEQAVLSFYSGIIDRNVFLTALNKGRVQRSVLDRFEAGVLVVGMISQYTARLFGLKTRETATSTRQTSLHDLQATGLVELRTPAGIPIPMGGPIRHDTEIHLVKAAVDEE